MKRFILFIAMLSLMTATGWASTGWPAKYSGVMLQGFYWNSYDATRWTYLQSQADELSEYFSLVWLPQSAKAANNPSMGYDDLYWFTNYNSSFGTESELRSLISTFRSVGIGTIADVVINHRGNVSTWTDFPKEVYNGVTYQLLSTDIVADDDNGATKSWADKNGVTLSTNNDSGESWGGMRDLDHYSTNVQNNVKAYLKMLLSDLGYVGFRYDMVKGYAPSFTGLYNDSANPTFSVGEYWDGNVTAVKAWIDGTKVGGVVQSAAFDFPLRYTIQRAVNAGNWSLLRNGTGVAKDSSYKRYAVTFVENHDTETRDDGTVNDPVLKDTIAANAYMMAMPGTPSVFLKHWIDCKRDIKLMISARKAAGINNLSVVTDYPVGLGYYAMKTTGDKADLITVVGTNTAAFNAPSGFTELQSGYHYRYLISTTANIVWTSLPSGSYDGQQKVTLRSIASGTPKLVYTLDGTTPTAQSTSVASGTEITLPLGKVTLKVGMLVAGAVTGVVTREYDSTAFTPHDITIHVNADNVGWTNVNFWTWGGDGSHSPTNTSWPGDKVTAVKTVGGRQWYYKSFRMNTSTDYVNIVVSTGTGSPQTLDVNNIAKDTYLEISSQLESSKHIVTDVTDIVTDIALPEAEGDDATADVYALDGRLVRSRVAKADALQGLGKGVYIVNNRKYVVR